MSTLLDLNLKGHWPGTKCIHRKIIANWTDRVRARDWGVSGGLVQAGFREGKDWELCRSGRIIGGDDGEGHGTSWSRPGTAKDKQGH